MKRIEELILSRLENHSLPERLSLLAGERIREGYLFFEKRYPSLAPSQRKFPLQASSSKSCNACRCYFLRAALPRLKLLYDLPLLLSSAVAQPLAALLPYGCGTPLAGAALPIL